MPTLLAINLVASLVMLGLAVHRATGQGCAMSFYPETIPTMVQAGFGAFMAAGGLAIRHLRFPCLAISSAALGLLGIPAIYAIAHWPGGDDGGGFGWLFIVGGGCAASFVIAGVTFFLGLGYRVRGNVSGSSPQTESPAAAGDAEHLGALGGSTDTDSRKRRGFSPARCLLWAILGAAGVYLVWVVLGPVSWTTTETVDGAGGIQVRTMFLHELCPFPVPFYHHVSSREQAVFVDGQEWFRAGPLDVVYPSPTGEFIAVQVWEKPIQVWRRSTRKSISLRAGDSKKEFPSHYYTYPFRFDRWDGGSAFLVTVAGGDISSGYYKQSWRVDATTGDRSRVD